MSNKTRDLQDRGDARKRIIRDVTRRQSFKVFGGAVIGSVAAPAILRGQSAGKVYARTTGGSAEEGNRKSWYEPFKQETGIEIVPVIFDTAKAKAMVKSGNVSVDIIVDVAPQMYVLAREGILEKLDKSKFSRTDLNDMERVEDHWLARTIYATVLGYNKEVFSGNHPKSWQDFWNAQQYPGARILQDASAEYPNLEFALLADGVPMDKLYPLDVDRAFKSLREVRKNILKWWDSGAVAAQMLSDKTAAMGSIWESRINPLIVKGAPLAIEWNQAMRNPNGIGILKGAPNLELAYKAIDFGMSPKIQAAMAREVKAAPANRKAYQYLDEAVASTLSTYPAHAKLGFLNNTDWWAQNIERVKERWREFRLEG